MLLADVDETVRRIGEAVGAGSWIRIRGVEPPGLADLLRRMGLAQVSGGEELPVWAVRPSAQRDPVPFFEDIASETKPGTPVYASDLMWRTAPTPDLLRTFPGTRPMEGYEMQVEECGFALEGRWDASRATLTAAARADSETSVRALAADSREAALWRTLVLRRKA
ncbi:MAG: hypothetical protein ACYDDF_09920 [Thermoplasmatota archaeon]